LLVDTLVVFATDRNNRPKIKEETLLLIERTIHHQLVRIFVNQVNAMFFSDRIAQFANLNTQNMDGQTCTKIV